MGLSTTNGISCSGSICLCPALIIFTCGRQTTSVPGILAWPWYQLRTVPGISPDTIVLGEGRLSFGRNTQHDCTSSCKNKVRKDFSETDYHFSPSLPPMAYSFWYKISCYLSITVDLKWFLVELRGKMVQNVRTLHSCNILLQQVMEEKVSFWSVNFIRKVLPCKLNTYLSTFQQLLTGSMIQPENFLTIKLRKSSFFQCISFCKQQLSL